MFAHWYFIYKSSLYVPAMSHLNVAKNGFYPVQLMLVNLIFGFRLMKFGKASLSSVTYRSWLLKGVIITYSFKRSVGPVSTYIYPMKFSNVFRIFLLEYGLFILFIKIGYSCMPKYRENPVFGGVIFLYISTNSIVRVNIDLLVRFLIV